MAEGTELVEGLVNVSLLILHRGCPFVLVKRLDLRARSAQDRADAIPTDEFRVSQVSDDLTNRPFPRRRTLTQFRRRDAFDQTFKLSWGSGK